MANPWYSTGTITVTNNSKEVSAVGALWVVNNVGAGDILFAPDGLAYEVETLSNDNLMTLKTVYKGASASSQPYGLVRFMSQSPISLANLIVDKTVRWEDVIDQLATYISGDATTSSVAPEDLCINYSLGTVKTGIAQVDCPVGFTFVASGANVDAGWFLFQDTVGNYRVSKHPETFRAEITALKDAAAASEAAAAQSALLAADSVNKLGESGLEISRAIRKAIYDRSGFSEFGGNSGGGNLVEFVNQGLWCHLPIWTSAYLYPNKIWMGSPDRVGSYETSPVINLLGHSLTISSTGNIEPYWDSIIELPDAPVVSHVDATNRGLVRNGSFSLGNNGDWTLGSADISAVYTGNSVQLSQTTSDNYVYQSFSTNVGQTYILEFKTNITNGDTSWSGVFIGTAVNSPAIIDTRIGAGGSGKQSEKIIFTATTSTTFLTYHLGVVTDTVELFDFAVYPESSVNRSDLILLEAWHEDTSEKDWLCDLGNTQYLGAASKTSGMPAPSVASFAGSDTYSLLGNWQAAGDLVGKGYTLSTLGFADLARFTANPNNNCYYTNDGKLIQIRLRIRVVEGHGDDWNNLDPELSDALCYTDGNTNVVTPKGKLTTVSSDLGLRSVFGRFTANNKDVIGVEQDEGVFTATADATLNYDPTLAFEGRLYALPIAIVKRLNQGMFHPVHNSRGCALRAIDSTGDNLADVSGYFHASTSLQMPVSTVECFGSAIPYQGNNGGNPARWVQWNGSANVLSGSISSAVSGRPDARYYDSVYADQITDLRLSANKNSTAYNTMQHFLSGSARGLEGDYHLDELPVAPYLRYTDADYSGTVVSHTNGMNSGEMLHCDIIGDPAFYPKTTIDYTTTGATQSVSVVKGNKVFVEVLGSATGTVGNYYVAKVDQASIDLNLQDFTNTSNWIDTGSTNSNGWQESLSHGHSLFGTPLLIGEDGTDLIPDGSGKTYKLSKKAKSIVYVVVSDNAGASWSVMSSPEAIWSWNSATNSYTPFAPIGRIGLIFYTTYPELLEPTLNSPITDGEIGSVIATSNLESSAIVQSLINKVPVGSETTHFVALSHHQDINANLVDISYSSIDLAASDVAVSMCAYKTEDGIEVVAKELKHDGVDWGDNSKITQADNVTTDTDLNAATVLVTTSKPKLKSDLR